MHKSWSTSYAQNTHQHENTHYKTHKQMNLPTGLGLSVFLLLAGNGGSNAFGTFGSNCI